MVRGKPSRDEAILILIKQWKAGKNSKVRVIGGGIKTNIGWKWQVYNRDAISEKGGIIGDGGIKWSSRINIR